jgi:hypothetical protein
MKVFVSKKSLAKVFFLVLSLVLILSLSLVLAQDSPPTLSEEDNNEENRHADIVILVGQEPPSETPQENIEDFVELGEEEQISLGIDEGGEEELIEGEGELIEEEEEEEDPSKKKCKKKRKD